MSGLHAWEDTSLAVSPSPAKTPGKGDKEASLLSQYLEASTVVPSPTHPWESPLSRVDDTERSVDMDMMQRLENLSKENHELRLKQNTDKEKVRCLQDDVAYLKDEASRLRKERNELSDRLRNQSGKKVWPAHPTDLEEDLSDAQADVSRLRRERDDLADKLRKNDGNSDVREVLRKNIQELREEHEAALRDLRSSYEDRLMKVNEKTSKLSMENEELAKALDQASRQGDAHRTNVALKKRLDELTGRVEDQAKLLQSPRKESPSNGYGNSWTKPDMGATRQPQAKQEPPSAAFSRALPPLKPVFEEKAPGTPTQKQPSTEFSNVRSPSIYNNRLESPRGLSLRRPSPQPFLRKSSMDPTRPHDSRNDNLDKAAASPVKSPSRSISPQPNSLKAEVQPTKSAWPTNLIDLPRTSVPSLSGRTSPSPSGQPVLHVPRRSVSNERRAPRPPSRTASPAEFDPPHSMTPVFESSVGRSVSPAPIAEARGASVQRQDPTPKRYEGRRSPPPVFTPSDEMRRGARVVRNPAAWKWEEQDGGPGSLGTAMEVDDGWVVVAWDVTGKKNCYRWGHMGIYDVTIVSPHETPRAPNSPRAIKTASHGVNPALGARLSPRPQAHSSSNYAKSPHPGGSPKSNVSPPRSRRGDVPSFSSS